MSLADLFKDNLTDDDSDEDDFCPEDMPESDMEIESEEGAFALHNAAESGKFEVLQTVIRNALADGEMDPTSRGFYLDKRDKSGCSPLHIALLRCHAGCVKVLVHAGANVNKLCHGSSPLHLAIIAGTFNDEVRTEFTRDIIPLLLTYKAVAYASPPGGGGIGAVHSLIRDGASRTVLHVAATAGLSGCVTALINSVEDKSFLVNALDRNGCSALHMASRFNHPETVKILLSHGAKVDEQNRMGRTPLHLAAASTSMIGKCAEILYDNKADDKILDYTLKTPAQWAETCNPKKQLRKTLVVTHPTCEQHHTCENSAYKRCGPHPPPENIRRLQVLLDDMNGVLRTKEFSGENGLVIMEDPPRCAIVDVMRCHDHGYVSNIAKMCNALPVHHSDDKSNNKVKSNGVTLDDLENISDSDESEDDNLDNKLFGDSDSETNPKQKQSKKDSNLKTANDVSQIAHLDSDTTLSRQSFEAALHAAGAVCHAIEQVCSGKARNAFCATRPPGHHAGPSGIENSEHDTCGSHGFCLFNNVAVGAAYARCVLRDQIDRVAILDFDVHHGNGTEAIVRNLTPQVREIEMKMVGAGMLHGSKISFESYKPWRNDTDHENVFFASVHGYGPRDRDDGEIYFYPGSGNSAKHIGGNVVNVGLPKHSAMAWREAWRDEVLPSLFNFNPDLIIISAGFDAHEQDALNHDFINLQDEDYAWFTEHVQSIANICCEGRVVSVLEGGYRVHSGAASPFARSVTAHVRAMHRTDYKYTWDPSPEAASREKMWRAEEEPRRHRDEEDERENITQRSIRSKQIVQETSADNVPVLNITNTDENSRPRKRRRGGTPVDYAALNKKLDAEAKAVATAKLKN